MKELFLGIDIGTGSSRGVITDASGEIISEAAVPHSMDMPAPGHYEQDADMVWWADFVRLSRSLIHSAGCRPEQICAAGISTIAPCVLPVDSAGRPLRPGIMYGIDTRASEEIRELEELVGRDEIFRITGQELSSQACCPKIRWIQKHEPAVWEKTSKVLTAAGYLVYRLTGRYTLDIYNAMAYGPLFNLAEKRWDNTHMHHIIDKSMLPELLWSSDAAGRITRKAAAETGLAEGTIVIAGTADAAAEAVGSGVCRTGDMMMMYGSSNFFILRTQELKPQLSFWASNFIDPGSSVLAGGMSTVGSMFKWLSETFPGRSLEEWEDLSRESVPGANGLTVLPYFAGERTPLNAPEARGVFFGMDLKTSAGDIFRAMQEAVGYGIRHNITGMERSGASAERIIAIGGAASSRDLLQTVSNITGMTQYLPSRRLGACYGDAFLAAAAAGHFKSSADSGSWAGVAGEIEPDRDLHDFYTEGYSRYRDLFESTRHLLKRI